MNKKHRRGRAAEVGEWRGDHAPVPDRHQIRHPGPGLLLEDVHRVGPVRRRLPLGMALARHVLAHLTPTAPPLIRREQLVWWGKDPRRHSGHETPVPWPRAFPQADPRGPRAISGWLSTPSRLTTSLSRRPCHA